MLMKLVIISFLFLPFVSLAQSAVPAPDDFFHIINNFSVAFLSLIERGINDPKYSIILSILMISFSIFFYVRSIQLFAAGKLSFIEFLLSKIVPLFALFTVLQPANYILVNNAIMGASKYLGNSLQFILTGFDDFSSLIGGFFLMMSSLIFKGPSFGILDWTFSVLLIGIIALVFYRQGLALFVTLAFYLVFSVVGFQIVMIMGLVTIPFVLVDELRFITIGWIKALFYMFIFSIVWKVLVSISILFVVASFFGSQFLAEIANGNATLYTVISDIVFSSSTDDLVFEINGIKEMLIPLIFMSVSVVIVSKAMAITQFILTGFLSSDNAIKGA